ncbi:MAG: 50S ribosomal protein L21 [Alphaproteobacteria bacterium]|nr:50S ribosomal protein L21 [Alphaproteobacteria bacterium]
MFAVIRTGGKQYKVTKDARIQVEKLEAKAGDELDIDDILLVNDGKATKVGAPVVSGAKVVAKVVEHIRGPKITIFKKKRRQNYRRKKGHRQDLTVLEITDIKAA